MTYMYPQIINHKSSIINQKRGSVLILVVAVLVLLVMIGTAYIQAARNDRNAALLQGDSAFYSPGSGTPGGDPVNDEIQRIKPLLKDDLVQSDPASANVGTFLDDLDGNDTAYAAPTYGPPWTYNPFSSREPYDYPHAEIDPWLASTAPQLDGSGNLLWLDPATGLGNISNVTGRPTIGPDVAAAVDEEPWIMSSVNPLPSLATGVERFMAVPDNDRDNNGTPYNPSLASSPSNWNPKDIYLDANGNGVVEATDGWDDRADADGDGITDSRFVDAAVGTINGRRYVAAIRIADLSALLNVNVATAQTDNLGAYDPTADAPRWLFPSELDFANFVFSLSDPADTEPEMLELLRYRLGGAAVPPLPTPWGGLESRQDFWLYGPSQYGNFNDGSSNTFHPLGMAEELKLRLRNGLNSPDRLGTAFDATAIPPVPAATDPVSFGSFLRDVIPPSSSDTRPSGMFDADGDSNVDTDVTFADAYIYAPSSLTGTFGYDYREIRSYSGASVAEQIAAYFAYEPRHQMTTLSGASIYLPGGTPPPVPPLQEDLNNLSLTALKDVIEDVYTGKTGNMVPAGWTAPPPTVVTDFAHAFAAAVIDYHDFNNFVKEYEDPVGTFYYGFEALPFITEVYVQGKYTAFSVTSVGPNQDQVQWNKTEQPSYAIEIRNPFSNHTVLLSDVYVSINGVLLDVNGDLSPDSLSTIAAPKDTLAPGEVLILYYNGGSAPQDDPSAMWAGSPDDLAGNITVVNMLTPPNWPQVAGDIDVALHATLEDNAGAIIDPILTRNLEYVTYTCEGMPDPVITIINIPSAGGTSATVGEIRRWQVGSIGNANGLNMLTIAKSDPKPYRENPNLDVINGDYAFPDMGTTDLGDPAKLDKQPSAGDVGTLGAEQIVWRDADFWSVAELALIPIIEYQDTDGDGAFTIAEAWADKLSVSQWTIPLDPANIIPPNDLVPTGGNLALPYAMILMDRFSSFDPATDGVDNDGDGGIPPVVDAADPQLDEIFVPGRININTVAGTVVNPTNPGQDDVSLNRHILQRVLPIPDPAVLDDVITRIIGYRDILNTTPAGPDFTAANRDTGIAGWRTLPGIASLAEIAPATQDVLTTVAGYTGSTPTLNDGVNNITIDFNPDPATDDTIGDDVEEQLLPLAWLNQVLTVRSDRFVVYGLIRGYNNGILNAANLAEQVHFIAILDRSGITDQNGQVRVLSIITY